ncbi:hypothetical protein Pmar_PMAR010141 [Perkinsus marinus ATCC 50983]|uniref:Uncharacterized protein n=1 Tax=Perkinsus marinus (strain ATCC 50983 / TXsc) TaxID=423536 RepID=C5K4Y5_PERM5|nr:hypothetical protein Pmar_PMAR010141 [Perkinsus marinus ATCC 50983]EER20407.1 hypothetical protein Pmar_PMAR010141 [Perkinsus marinus ATCC 50983]|eukprot:XP_002788611.1 hypothetical protein Pmar_PMAR010141 [Perkinsus marinus ATCC 50983]
MPLDELHLYRVTYGSEFITTEQRLSEYDNGHLTRVIEKEWPTLAGTNIPSPPPPLLPQAASDAHQGIVTSTQMVMHQKEPRYRYQVTFNGECFVSPSVNPEGLSLAVVLEKTASVWSELTDRTTAILCYDKVGKSWKVTKETSMIGLFDCFAEEIVRSSTGDTVFILKLAVLLEDTTDQGVSEDSAVRCPSPSTSSDVAGTTFAVALGGSSHTRPPNSWVPSTVNKAGNVPCKDHEVMVVWERT